MNKLQNLYFVPYNIAKLLKEKGFDEPCFREGNPHGHIMWRFGCTDDENDTLNIKDIISQKLHEDFIGIPLYQSVQNWLLEKHGIWIYVDTHEFGKWCYNFKNVKPSINHPKINEVGQFGLEDYNTPQEAMNSAIEYCLKNLIK
jgi:hypothetical protein